MEQVERKDGAEAAVAAPRLPDMVTQIEAVADLMGGLVEATSLKALDAALAAMRSGDLASAALMASGLAARTTQALVDIEGMEVLAGLSSAVARLDAVAEAAATISETADPTRS
jgi:hypothetical protein